MKKSLEDRIMDAWGVVEDIETVTDNVVYMSQDETMNALIGIKQLYDLKFQALFHTFEEMLHDNHNELPPTKSDDRNKPVDH